jgi:hypothetical protein
MIQETRWDLATDVAVIAGVEAAITAHDAGGQVLVLKRQESENFMTTSYEAAGP